MLGCCSGEQSINPTAMLLNPLDDTTHPYRARCPGDDDDDDESPFIHDST